MRSSLKQAAGAAALLGLLVQPAFAAVEFLNSGKIASGDLPFSEAVKVDKTLYLSGQLGVDPATHKLAAGGVGPETHQTMKNIQTVLQAHGYEMKDVIKCTVFLADIKEWPAFNEAYRDYFKKGAFPARSALGSIDLVMGARVEVECMASK